MIGNRTRRIFFWLVLYTIMLSWVVFLSGCHTTQALYLEAQCGLGKDYVCSPQWVEAGDPNYPGDNEMHIVCGCMDKKDLKGN